MDALQAKHAHTLVITLTFPFLQFPLIPGMLQVDFLLQNSPIEVSEPLASIFQIIRLSSESQLRCGSVEISLCNKKLQRPVPTDYSVARSLRWNKLFIVEFFMVFQNIASDNSRHSQSHMFLDGSSSDADADCY
jgi:hypothetical protein